MFMLQGLISGRMGVGRFGYDGSLREIAYPSGDDLGNMLPTAAQGDLVALEECDVDGQLRDRSTIRIHGIDIAGVAIAFREGTGGNKIIGFAGRRLQLQRTKQTGCELTTFGG